MTEDLRDIWVYLAASPLLHLTLTLVAYQGGLMLYRRGRMNPLLNPVLVAVLVIVALLAATGTEYRTYFDGAQFVHFLLGPATVALAIPLYRQFDKVRRSALAVLASITIGSMTAALSAVAIVWFLDASADTVISIAPKSVTAPVAMGITERLGGLPSLTAVLVILTGILGAMLGPLLLDLLRVRDWRAAPRKKETTICGRISWRRKCRMSRLHEWLDKAGVGEHEALFVENDVDLDVLAHFTEGDLKEMGLSIGHRRSILAAVAELDAEEVSRGVSHSIWATGSWSISAGRWRMRPTPSGRSMPGSRRSIRWRRSPPCWC